MALIGQAVSEKKIFENGGRRTDDGRTPDHGHPISSPCEPNGSGELKNLIFSLFFFFFAQTLTVGSNVLPTIYVKKYQNLSTENF